MWWRRFFWGGGRQPCRFEWVQHPLWQQIKPLTTSSLPHHVNCHLYAHTTQFLPKKIKYLCFVWSSQQSLESFFSGTCRYIFSGTCRYINKRKLKHKTMPSQQQQNPSMNTFGKNQQEVTRNRSRYNLHTLESMCHQRTLAIFFIFPEVCRLHNSLCTKSLRRLKWKWNDTCNIRDIT